MNRFELGKNTVAHRASQQYFVLRVQQVNDEMGLLCLAARFNKPLQADAPTGDVSDQSGSVMPNQAVSVTNQPIKTQLLSQQHLVSTAPDRQGRDPVTA